ncbi:MAG: EI24 domain-containing protein [Alphaproteobacteria bacterium]
MTTMYVQSIIRAFGQVRDPASAKVFLGSVGAALGLAIISGFGVFWALSQMRLETWAWLDSAGDFIGGILAFLILMFLFPGIVVVVSSLFLDVICKSVDARWYPNLGTPREQPVMEGVQGAVMFALKALMLNLLILPLLLLGPVYPIAYLMVNAHLLSSEYFELVAVRRMDLKSAKQFAKQNRGKLWLSGFPIAAALPIPLLNLLVPILAASYMSHIFHRLNPPIETAGDEAGGADVSDFPAS